MNRDGLIRKGSFRNYVIKEERLHLVDEVRSVLEAFMRLEKDIRQLGARQAVKAADEVVGLARQVLGMWWRQEDMPLLEELQKAAVAVAKAADENQDLSQTVAGARQLLDKAVQSMSDQLKDTGGTVQTPPFI